LRAGTGYGNTNGKDYRIFILNTGNNARTVHAPGYGTTSGYEMKGEYNGLYNFCDIKNLVFLTSNIPAKNEFYSQQTLNTSTSGSQRQILNDYQFETLFQLGTNPQRPYISYKPPIYRKIDLVSNQALSTIDIQVFFLTFDGRLRPLLMNPADVFSVKLLFSEKK
jgi:hypothetical protein